MTELEKLREQKKEITKRIKELEKAQKNQEVEYKNLKLKPIADYLWERGDPSWIISVQYITGNNNTKWNRIIRDDTRDGAIQQIHSLVQNLLEFEMMLKEGNNAVKN